MRTPSGNAAEASHLSRIRTWFPALAFITAWRRNDRFGPTALPLLQATSNECRICQSELPIRHLAIDELATPAVASGPSCSLLQRATSKVGEEAATPGQPVALARVSGISPGNSPSRIAGAAGSAAIIRQAQELSRFAEPTLSQIVASRNTKNLCRCAEPVEDENSLWKIEENLRRIAGVT